MSPQNILVGAVGQDQFNELYLFDFSLASLYRDPRTYAHVPFCGGNATSTSCPFASINGHLGSRLSRRDDLESLAYLLIYLARGSLPWIDTAVEADDHLLQKKKDISIVTLCDTLPSVFISFLTYVRELSFTQKPDYDYVLSLFRSLRTDGAPTPILYSDVHIPDCIYWLANPFQPTCLDERHPPSTPVARSKRVHETFTPPTLTKRYVSTL